MYLIFVQVDVAKHFVARVMGLIVLPIAVYLFFFAVHFQALPRRFVL